MWLLSGVIFLQHNKVFMLFCSFPQWLTAPPLDRSSRTGRTAPGTTAPSVCPWRMPATRETSSVRLIHIYKYSTCTDTFSASLWVYFPRRILTIFSEIYFMTLYITTLHKRPTSTVMWFNCYCYLLGYIFHKECLHCVHWPFWKW